MVETHVSTLFFVGDRVYKLKKPVRTAFLDFSTVERRRAACEEEVAANRRLSPDSYLGVAEVRLGDRAVDHLVVMVRYPDSCRLARLLDDADIGATLREVARAVAAFHERARRGPEIDAVAGPEGVAALWEAELGELAAWEGRPLDPAVSAEVADLVHRYLAGRSELLGERVAHGRACDGHGDLLAEDIFCLPDGPRILDCIEFDDRLRYGDVLADVAFLAMDLERLGRADLGSIFLAAYREFAADTWPDSLAHLYIAYRAHVRCKVACMRHDQGDPEAAAAACRLLELSRSHLRKASVRLVVVGGGPGTGKTTVAAAAAECCGGVVISSDDVRRDVVSGAGAPNLGLGQGRYEPHLIDAVYQEMYRRAAMALRHGASVVLDATFARSQHRRPARELAERAHAELTELQCSCPAALAVERVRQRLATGESSSEVTPEMVGALAARIEEWPESTVLSTVAEGGEVAGLLRSTDLGPCC